MTKAEIITAIEFKYAFTKAPSHTVVQTNTVIHYGFFHKFFDYAKLRSQGKYRFIQANNSVDFQLLTESLNGSESKEESGEARLALSIIINVEDIVHIDLIL